MKEMSLNDRIYEIVSVYSSSTAAGMIRDLVKEEMDKLQKHMKSTEFKSSCWTEEIDNEMSNYIESDKL